MVNRKIFTCIGCGMTHFILGTIYCTGNITPYIASYIRLKDDTITMASMTIVFYICTFAYTISFQISNLIQKRYRPKICIYAGSALYISVVYVAAALQDRIAVIVIYGVVLGISAGIAYPGALMIAIACYPEKKGLIAGMIVGSFALGAFFFNFIATGIVNPDNKKPVVYIVNGVKEKFFEKDVAENVPKMFLILASIYLVIISIGILLIEDIDIKPPVNNALPGQPQEGSRLEKTKTIDYHDIQHLGYKENDAESSKAHTHFHSELHSEAHSEGMSDEEQDHSHEERSEERSEEHNEENKMEENKDEKTSEYKRVQTLMVNPELDLNVYQALTTRQFHQIFWPYLLSGMTGLFAAASFKTIGIKYSYDDEFLTIVGSLGSIMNGTMRPLWGLFFDKTSFKVVYLVILSLQIALCFTFPSINKFKPSFLIWIVILTVCSGGHFTILAPTAVRIYQRGTGAKIYSFLIIAIGVSCLIVYFIQVYATDLGPSVFYYIIGGFSCVSLISTIFFSEIIKINN